MSAVHSFPTAEPTVPALQAVVLAAGRGTRLGRELPKPLTALRDGRSILRQQVDNLRQVLGDDLPVTAVVGHLAEVVRAAAPDLAFVDAPDYATTNTSRSLLLALEASRPGGVLWLNGDVVFDPAILAHVRPLLEADETFVCVDTAVVGEEEVKYTVDAEGWVRELSKTVAGGLGEAVGINFVASTDKALLIEHLRACADSDYFERGLETAVADAGLRVRPVDISAFEAVEVDVEADLDRALLVGFPERAAG